MLSAGPGWSVLGVLKMLAGSYLVTLALREGVPVTEAADPTRMYHVAFDQLINAPVLVLTLTGVFVILSQMKINVTNAYAGSIAWSNFFSRLTQTHPGRVVWLVFNVSIALMLMELGVFTGLEHVLGVYSHVAVAWIGALVADLVVNKPLGLSPKGIEFRRAHLYDINPVGIGSMIVACIVAFLAYSGVLGPLMQAFSAFVALGTSFALAPVIAWATGGKYYLARPAQDIPPALQTCGVCRYRFDAEDVTDCPFHAAPICSLCCTLDASCHDRCRPKARLGQMIEDWFRAAFATPIANALLSRTAQFLFVTTLSASAFGGMLLLIRSFAAADNFDAVLMVIFGAVLIVIGVSVWMFLLVGASRKSAIAEAERQSERLLMEIRAHERTDIELQAAKDKAEAANLAKTRYMSGLSHELRTPLNAIYGFAQLLEKDHKLEPWRPSLTSIRRSSEHLAGLIEGLLDISRIESGRIEIMRDRINLHVFLNQITSIFEEEARDKGIAFSMRTEGKLPAFVRSDEKRLRQIIINILSNAIRYTDQGSVDFLLTYRNEVALIEVHDTGRGIAQEYLSRIWRPFERAGRSDAQGSGLGLTITKLLVEILGGEIDVESTPGVGSTFRVRLMLPSIMPSAFAPNAVVKEPGTQPFTGYDGPRKTVLVVDDDHNHLALVDRFLSDLGFVVLCASGVAMAETMLEDASPNIILLDIDMPERDGWSFARSLRASVHQHTPIIMISGHAHEEGHHRRELGLHDAFLAKPYNLDDLLMQITELLKVKLVLSSPKPVSVGRSISSDEVARLKELAQIGHAGALRASLNDLRDMGAGPDALIQDLSASLEQFDMARFVETLEAQHECN